MIAVAESGNVAVPLVGGHHGAITLARQVADAVGANLAITTAGDDRWGIRWTNHRQAGGLPIRRPRSVSCRSCWQATGPSSTETASTG